MKGRNKEKLKAYKKQWRIDNPEKVKLYGWRDTQRISQRRREATKPCGDCGKDFLTYKRTDRCPDCVKQTSDIREPIKNSEWQRGKGRECHNYHAREYERRKAKRIKEVE